MAGVRRLVDMTDHLRAQLEAGAPSRTHVEQMAIRMERLFLHAFPEAAARSDILQELRALEGLGFISRMRGAARILVSLRGSAGVAIAATHASDTVRGWAAFAVPLIETPELVTRALVSFADDEHFAVREWAWLALRPVAISQTAQVVSELSELTGADSANVRRYCSESIRPRGVWSAHIPAIKANPDIALAVVDPLVCDPERYVQLSVGNLLHDIAIDNPQWLRSQFDRWRTEGVRPAGTVASRALR